jgi:hypothetical protein
MHGEKSRVANEDLHAVTLQVLRRAADGRQDFMSHDRGRHVSNRSEDHVFHLLDHDRRLRLLG